jgi:hypothetical protein
MDKEVPMSGDNTISARLAAALVPHVSTPAAAGVLLDAAILGWPADLTANLSLADVLKAKQGPASKALTAAASTRDSAALAKLARDSRVTVQRHVAARIDQLVTYHGAGLDDHMLGALRHMHNVAIKRDDSDLFRTVAKRLPVAELLERLPESTAMFPCDAVAKRVIDNADPDEWRLLLDSDEVELAYRVLVRLDAAPCGDLTIDEAVARISNHDTRYHAVLQAFYNASPASAAITGYLLGYGERVWSDMGLGVYGMQRQTWTRHTYHVGSGHSFDAEAARMLLEAPLPERASGWVLSTVVPAEVIDLAIETAGAVEEQHAMGKFIAANASQLNAGQVGRIIELLHERQWLQWVEVYRDLGLSIPEDLDAPTCFTLLESIGDVGMVVSFLERGGLQPGDVTAWVKGSPKRKELRMFLASVCRSGYSRFAEHPWSDEVLDALGEELLNVVLVERDVARRVAQRLEAGLGEDQDLWKAMLSLGDDLGTERVESLVNAVRVTMGRPAVPARTDVTLVVEDDGQIALAF